MIARRVARVGGVVWGYYGLVPIIDAVSWEAWLYLGCVERWAVDGGVYSKFLGQRIARPGIVRAKTLFSLVFSLRVCHIINLHGISFRKQIIRFI